MKKVILSGCILFLAMAGFAIAGTQGLFLSGLGLDQQLTATYQQFNAAFTGDWQQYGQTFTSMQGGLFARMFLLVLTVVPLIFFLHYVAIGPMSFPHDGRMVYCYNLFVRLVHWVAAISCSLLILTGLLIIYAKFVGGGSIGLLGRNIHLLAAIAFTVSAVFMLFFWLKDMLPALYDLQWMIIMGGYLSKKIEPVPAGKFNAGQKMWFWLATVGGLVMAFTGYFLYNLQGNIDTLRLYAIIHNFLGAAMVAMFIIHVYMSMFAIKGALQSMINGYKAEAELKILHSKFKI